MVIVVCGVMYNKAGRILMGMRGGRNLGKKDGNRGKWEFPGGQLEHGESMNDCLKREWKEELNLEIEIDTLIHRFNFKKLICIFITGTIVDEENIKMLDHEDIGFFTKEQIYDLNIFEEDIVVVDKL
jgi:8-oxo-dGTP diphosphatase